MNGAGAAPGAATPRTFPTGWYGKIPATGDFIARRLPASFSESWDRWLQAAVEGSRARLGTRWRDSFLSMPVWRFILAPGVLTQNAWAGLMVPSVDAVGRYFPLTVAAALPEASVDEVATLAAAATWFDQIEAIALKAIAPDADTAAIDAALAGWPFKSEWLRLPRANEETMPIKGAKSQMLWVPLLARTPNERLPASLRELAERMAEPYSAWLAEESEVFGRCLLLCEALPAADHYCAMMDGRWIEHGWGHRKIGA
jgi:type VI secretion system protein ImpM